MAALLLAAGQPNETAYVAVTYAVVIAVLVAFIVATTVRARHIGKRLPPEDRRWM